MADHCPTSMATAKHRRPLPIPATTQNHQMSSSIAHSGHYPKTPPLAFMKPPSE
ncbi:hypothetical protein FH972_017048 [Carpinus fangiana]|uniref:Uncharacterized protein n=1 Tax=Carpinus fangiana TaxID=176857 RepID=A0A5N6RHS4_9ROSI|nr:hypothetical protein FH972_017048 [Carpinus fangiana]